MRFIKRIVALLMITSLVLALLAACGKKEETEETESTAEIDYFASASQRQIELFGDLSGTELRVVDDALEEQWKIDFYTQLEELTGMEVEAETLSSGELFQKVTQAVASGDTRNYYDVVVISNNLLKAIYGNLIIPMDKYIDREDPVWKYSYSDIEGFIAPDIYKVDGKIWGSPSHGYHETFIFYNKTYFQEVGAPDPYEEYYLKDNWTMETFLDTCEAVTKKNADGEVEVAAWASWNYFSFATAFGNNCIAQNNKNKWEVIIDQPNGIAGLDVLYQCAENGWLDTKVTGYEEFVNRKIAMIIDKPSSAMAGPEAYSRMSDEIGMIPLPKMDATQEKYVCPLTATGHAIAACAQNPAGAAAWIYYQRLSRQTRHEQFPDIREGALNAEAQERRSEYLTKCEFAYSMIDGLQGWYNEGGRGQALNMMFKNHNAPATVVDSMKGVIADCLRKTVG